MERPLRKKAVTAAVSAVADVLAVLHFGSFVAGFGIGFALNS